MTITEEEEIASPKQKRQKRFLQKERNKRKWSDIVRHVVGLKEITPKMIGTAANHGKLCSCHMCGNPRKFFNEKTLQEQKFDEKAKSYVENIS